MRTADLDGEEAYGTWENIFHVKHMRELNASDQKNYVKELWEDDPKLYAEWKACVLN